MNALEPAGWLDPELLDLELAVLLADDAEEEA